MNTPGVGERLREFGNELVPPRSPEYLRNFIVSETEKWGNLLKAATSKRSDAAAVSPFAKHREFRSQK
jgi:hypothetical protein